MYGLALQTEEDPMRAISSDISQKHKKHGTSGKTLRRLHLVSRGPFHEDGVEGTSMNTSSCPKAEWEGRFFGGDST